jgi:hypothetical protein
MNKPLNRIVRTGSGVAIHAGDEVARGGQAILYAAVNSQTGQKGFLKQFMHSSPAERAAITTRTKFLVNARLCDVSPLFRSAPTEWYVDGDDVGHFAPQAPGSSLDDLMQGGWAPDFLGLLQLALALVHAVSLLHARGWAHGDLHAANLYVDAAENSVLKPTFIDYDNFWHASMPAPQNSIGQVFYLAPEQRVALAKGESLPPDQAIERYMLAVLLHTVLLLRHPAHQAAEEPERFNAQMTAGVWPDDPARGERPVAGGYPPSVLNVALQGLFRRGFSLRLEERPTPQEWERVLDDATNLVFVCPRCGGPVVLDRSKIKCPFAACAKPYPALGVVLPGGKTLPISGGGLRLGRDDLGGSRTVSRVHAVFERFGGEFRVVNYGANGLYRSLAGSWERLPDRAPFVLQPGDVLRFADSAEVLLQDLG